MKSLPSFAVWVGILSLAAGWSVQPAFSWQGVGISPTEVAGGRSLIEFVPPAQGTCRTTMGTLIRGRIVSVSEDEVVIINERDVRLTVQAENVRIVRTTDGEFQYEPASDDFRDVVRRATGRAGIRVTVASSEGTTSGGVVPPVGSPAPDRNPNRPPAGAGGSRPNRPGAGETTIAPPLGTAEDNLLGSQAGTVAEMLTTQTAPIGATPPLGSTPGAVSASTSLQGTTTESVICSGCQREVSGDAQFGNKCPHCGALWVSQPIHNPGGPTPTVATQGNPGGTSFPAAGQTRGNSFPQGDQPVPVQTPAASSWSEDFSFDAMPLWAKIGAFIGLLFLMYMLVASRR